MRFNLFIAGVPKSGTTSLYEYLRRHPAIFMSPMKEPGFFATDLNGHRRKESKNDYDLLLRQARIQHRVYGEATTLYMYSERAFEGIRTYNPDANIVVMLRNPVDAVYSWHAHLCRLDHENEESFEAAWKLQNIRRKGKRIPAPCSCPMLLQYRHVYSYLAQLERLYRFFPKEQVHLILFDDLMNEPVNVYEKLLRFLDVPRDGRAEFPIYNEHRTIRIKWLSQLTNRPPRSLLRAGDGIKSLLGVDKFGVIQLCRRFAQRNAKRPALRPEFMNELIDVFRPDIQRLSSFMGRDLNHWISRSPLHVLIEPSTGFSTPSAREDRQD